MLISLQANQGRNMANTSPGVNILIEKVNHHFTLEGENLPVLENINLQVKSGEFVSLLVPSCCGKSTLLRLLPVLDHPFTGLLSDV